ncbi:calcium/calmodulin-dependent protein kinase [Bisporella sp. PMI_857]|nr:calcium/calmodulin-dependent protein kinase [Bisporella sp. PMI_857]
MSSFAGNCEPPGHAGDVSKHEAESGILPSHGISIDLPDIHVEARPALIHHLSTPAYHSPLRHHRRTPSHHRFVKETLNARSEYTNNEEDGKGEHHINQYLIKDEIGRGSFGAVHYAVDQYGKEYAVKEFSKSRLRKRAQSNILRRPHSDRRRPGHLAAATGFNSPLHRHSASDIHDDEGKGNPLYLIKEEIAIMKKLNHPNLVSLIEVLDDPEEDSLYMVLEMCKKGVVMKVGLGEKASPYDVESCRCWFRDLILGIEYLHAQGIVHRDIKPDNLLLTEDDVLKIVDFGVSEMFEKASDMKTAKSAGSPAFMPPELCVTKHGEISGKAADIWSMGVSLYCLRFGRIPFERSGVLELYDAIKHENLKMEFDVESEFVDLMNRLLEKDPSKRITMREIRDHPWVTKNGQDPLLSEAENTADLVEPPSALEVNHAITTKMRNLIVMMKAVKKFKTLLEKKKRFALSDTFGRYINSQDPQSMVPHRSRSVDAFDRQSVDGALAAEEVCHDIRQVITSGSDAINTKVDQKADTVTKQIPDIKHHESTHEKGHAHDPLDEEPLFLGIGTGGDDSLETPPSDIIAESPTAAEFSIYDTAYQQEVERIRAAQGHSATVYLTRRVDTKDRYKADKNMVETPHNSEIQEAPREGFKFLLETAREKTDRLGRREAVGGGEPSTSFSDIAARAMENTKNKGREMSERGNAKIDSALAKAVEVRKARAERKEAEKNETEENV